MIYRYCHGNGIVAPILIIPLLVCIYASCRRETKELKNRGIFAYVFQLSEILCCEKNNAKGTGSVC